MFGKLIDRLNEPSTHAGMGLLASAASTYAANHTAAGVASAMLQAAMGVLAIVSPEKS